MTAPFDDTAKEEIRSKADIAAIVGRYVKLKPSGQTLKGCCPFHKEKTPSFHVNPSRGFFHCFGCGKGGDVFKFLQDIESITFPEALAMLSEETGVALKRPSERNYPDADQTTPQLSKTALVDLNKEAEQYFYRQIRSSPLAIEYFKSRGLKPETVRDFKLGYAPAGWTSFLTHAAGKNITSEMVVAAGLAINKDGDGNSVYDRFRDRVMFSLIDLSGRTIGFAGRGMTGDATPKYLNSPETLLYKKKEFLYGLFQTRQYIKDEKFVLVVEGYMDFLTLFQSGIRNVVASSGTALTVEHAGILKRFTSRVVLVFDGDNAGQNAAERGIVTLAPFDLDVTILVLPAEEDPDSYVKRYGAEPFRELIKNTRGANEFIIGKAIATHGKRTPSGQKAVIEQLLPLYQTITDPLAKSRFQKDLSENLCIDEKIVYNYLRNKTLQGSERSNSSNNDEVYLRSLEGSFLHLCITKPELIAEARHYVSAETLTDSFSADIYLNILRLYDEKGNLDGIIDRTSATEAKRLISRMLVSPALEEHIHEELVQKIIHLRAKFLRVQLRETKIRMKQEPHLRAQLLQQLKEYSTQLQELDASE